MYTLERTKKMKAIWGCLAAAFFGLSVLSFFKGGGWLILEGSMDEPLPSIVMVVSFFASILSVVIAQTLDGIEKDAKDHLSYLKRQDQ